MILKQSATYFNPDEATKRILAANRGITLADANSAAWHEGTRLLQRAINERLDFAFETTLGGRTITEMLQSAMDAGVDVRVWYVGLNTRIRYLARVKARVAEVGTIFRRKEIWNDTIEAATNLIRILPKLSELRVYDNSEEGDPSGGALPKPRLILHFVRKRIVEIVDLNNAPDSTNPYWLRLFQASDLNKRESGRGPKSRGGVRL